MKKYIITNIETDRVVRNNLNIKGKSFNYEFEGGNDMEVSDGYHTMDELYEHRVRLFIELCKFMNTRWEQDHFMSMYEIWRSKLHHDGTGYEDWFILGINKDKGEQITYHLPMSKWDETGFAETLEKAPEFDGHTSKDVLERLKTL